MTDVTPAALGAPLVVVQNVQKHYGEFQALTDIDLTVHKGEVVVIIGPSGSGKSTLCRTINRLETITSGSITIDGEELPAEGKGLAQLRADVGMVFQSFNLFAHLTILENVTLGPIKVRGMKKADAEKEAMQLLERVGVAKQASKLPAQLSGGQQQRVAIARALAYEADILLMDEPFASVDAQTRFDLEDLLLDLRRQLGISIVVVTHDIDEAVYLSDRVTVLSGAPASVAEVVDVHLDAPREQIGTKADPRFSEYRTRILKRIRRPELAAVRKGGDA
ncbi:MAG: amino acid ABC transporter ATP-binding protein [Actinobacteria bacterium]|nr:amino acid ABC transporter ATP-binding protein [Actinomycetota bacterium]